MNTLNSIIFICLFYCSRVNSKALKSQDSKGRLFQQNSCKVKEIQTGILKTCEGTFIYEGKTYYGCTSVGKDRCQFKVNQNYSGFQIQAWLNQMILITFEDEKFLNQIVPGKNR